MPPPHTHTHTRARAHTHTHTHTILPSLLTKSPTLHPPLQLTSQSRQPHPGASHPGHDQEFARRVQPRCVSHCSQRSRHGAPRGDRQQARWRARWPGLHGRVIRGARVGIYLFRAIKTEYKIFSCAYVVAMAASSHLLAKTYVQRARELPLHRPVPRDSRQS
jgi:hypothetical protein